MFICTHPFLEAYRFYSDPQNVPVLNRRAHRVVGFGRSQVVFNHYGCQVWGIDPGLATSSPLAVMTTTFLPLKTSILAITCLWFSIPGFAQSPDDNYPIIFKARKPLGDRYELFEQKIDLAHDIGKETINRVMDNYLMDDVALLANPEWFELWFGPVTEESVREVRLVMTKLQDIYNDGFYMITVLGDDEHVGSYMGLKPPFNNAGARAFPNMPVPMFTFVNIYDLIPTYPAEPTPWEVPSAGIRIPDEPLLNEYGFPLPLKHQPDEDKIRFPGPVFRNVGFAQIVFHELAHTVNLCDPDLDDCPHSDAVPWETPEQHPYLIRDFAYGREGCLSLAEDFPELGRRCADSYARFLFSGAFDGFLNYDERFPD